MVKATALILLACGALLCRATHAIAHGCSPNVAHVVALDECDPDSFNLPIDKGGLGDGGGGFCHNVSLKAFGYATSLPDLIMKAKAGTPDPGWDFEPDQLTIQRGTMLTVSDQGGEPHTFTEVAQFGGGFIKDLNHGEPTVPECDGGFSNVAVAKTRIVQGGHLDITGLSKGKHLFQCCIHPWMRMEVDVN
jgi:plastocyanin